MNKQIYKTYIEYQILIPAFFRDENNMHNVNKLWWYFCKLQFWRYKMNTELNCLVQMNNYTRPKHFTENWNVPSTFNDAKDTLRKIAGF